MRSRCRKRNSHWGWLVFTAILAAGYWFAPVTRPFSQTELDKLAANSELKNVQFKADVKEIFGQKTKVGAYLLEDKENPIVSVSFMFKNAGYVSDNADEQGIAGMAAALLGEGAGTYSSDMLKEELETRAIKINFAADKDDFTGSMLTTKDNLTRAAELFNLILTEPRFEADDVIRGKMQMLNALRRQNENPNQVLLLEFNKELYGSHPYARNPLGREADIEAVDQAKLHRFVKNKLIAKNLLVGIAGDIDEAEGARLLDMMFRGVPENGSLNFVRNADLQFDGRSRTIDRNIGQNITLMAVKGAGRTDEDFYPLYVANYVLGGAGLTSRLSQKIREEKGLTYGVYSYLQLDDKAPLIAAGFAVTKDKYAEAEKLFEEQWREFGAKGITQEELDKAKKYLTASNNLRFASIENISAMLAMMQKYNLGLDFLQKRNEYISQINLENVNRVIKKYFVPQMVSVKIGSF